MFEDFATTPKILNSWIWKSNLRNVTEMNQKTFKKPLYKS